MATTGTKKMSKAPAKSAGVVNEVQEIQAPVVNNEEPTPVKEKKVFANTDMIPCRSITVGGLYMEGIKTGELYSWTDEGEIIEVEYQDLLAAVRQNSKFVTDPCFLIEDEDFIEQNPKLNSVYEAMYSVNDLRDVLTTIPYGQIASVVKSLPIGAQNAIRDMATQMVVNGELDSINKIKALDETFGTNLMIQINSED